uniref:Uncharacterized protein n=1 Tax=Anguilla anguilla TaxID=7936 RepID=A0A0E9QRZ8_ANGAN
MHPSVQIYHPASSHDVCYCNSCLCFD